MAGTQPVAVYALRIPPGDILVPAVPSAAAMFRLTMAAIDPSEEPEVGAAESKKPRATLKVVRVPADMLDDDDDSDEDDYEDIDDDDEDEDSEDEGVNGGPSEKKIKAMLAEAEEDSDMDEDDDADIADAAEAQAVLAKLMAANAKGKAKALEEDDEEDDEDSDLDDLGMDECVLCTLDAEKQYQQPLDFVVAEGERVFFKVSGNLTVHLTGNYVMPIDEPSDDEEDDEDEYDLSPDEEDELDGLDALLNGGDESDDLDDIEDPRVMEVDTDEEQQKKPKAAVVTKGKNKRPAEDDDEEVSLDNIMAKSLKDEAVAEQPKKLSKAEKKAAKKLKNNEGEAATPPQDTKKASTQANGAAADSGKKVQFAKNLEQGPTPSKADAKAEKKPESKTDDAKKSTSLGVRDVQGVSVDDRKAGTGPAAKKGSKLEMRYIGKLDNGKQFDANKSGKPFSFKLGVGEVIKGWDIGLAGISAGGERRLIIPAHLAYGKKALPGIPANSKLTFDIKCLAVK